ncbi:uncharacterized protein LOC127278614 [Leptopilina boulardi]|uniref:uncharacterized protein LOC127278614 n=1 Tax=Leptopilina boulardi TaxID=63433 RepID=UPI0021F56D93|nr:uncharacterized protein LOC127278614 [Leptopilina boulardi]
MNVFAIICQIFCILISVLLAQVCYDDGSEFCLNENDILSVDLLPGSFILGQPNDIDEKKKIFDNLTVDGSFNTAFGEMGYHRQRMNEYLCHGYIAEEIFNEVGPTRIKRRLQPPPENIMSDFINENNVTVHDKLLSDEGSSKYKDWLQRTTTLNDVYQHYSPQRRMKVKTSVRPEDDFQDYDGEVTSYGVPMPVPPEKSKNHYAGPLIPASSAHHVNYGPPPVHYAPPSYGPSSHGPSGHGFSPSVHEEHYYFPTNHHEDSHHVHHSKKGGELSVKDFFEIALTALAFLAFGLFIIHLLMSIANAVTSTTTTASSLFADLPLSNSRAKRSAFNSLPLSYSGNSELNELSHRVLRSIEAAMIAQNDFGNCLRRVLCEDNSYAKHTEGGQRIWIPVWSLGMSWVSGRILNKSPWSAMLNSVKASVLGIGNADCISLYPACNLERERIKRRRRRRK